jgi:hypothetical protein
VKSEREFLEVVENKTVKKIRLKLGASAEGAKRSVHWMIV